MCACVWVQFCACVCAHASLLTLYAYDLGVLDRVRGEWGSVHNDIQVPACWEWEDINTYRYWKHTVCVYINVRGRAHWEILCKYSIFGCQTHFGHIAASPYAKWLNIDSASYGSLSESLVAAASLNIRSVCKLRVISAVAPHSSPPSQVHSMKGGIWTTK